MIVKIPINQSAINDPYLHLARALNANVKGNNGSTNEVRNCSGCGGPKVRAELFGGDGNKQCPKTRTNAKAKARKIKKAYSLNRDKK